MTVTPFEGSRPADTPKMEHLKFWGVGEYTPGTLNCAALVPFRGV